MKKKYLLMFGGLTALALPIIAASCAPAKTQGSGDSMATTSKPLSSNKELVSKLGTFPNKDFLVTSKNNVVGTANQVRNLIDLANGNRPGDEGKEGFKKYDGTNPQGFRGAWYRAATATGSKVSPEDAIYKQFSAMVSAYADMFDSSKSSTISTMLKAFSTKDATALATPEAKKDLLALRKNIVDEANKLMSKGVELAAQWNGNKDLDEKINLFLPEGKTKDNVTFSDLLTESSMKRLQAYFGNEKNVFFNFLKLENATSLDLARFFEALQGMYWNVVKDLSYPKNTEYLMFLTALMTARELQTIDMLHVSMELADLENSSFDFKPVIEGFDATMQAQLVAREWKKISEEITALKNNLAPVSASWTKLVAAWKVFNEDITIKANEEVFKFVKNPIEGAGDKLLTKEQFQKIWAIYLSDWNGAGESKAPADIQKTGFMTHIKNLEDQVAALPKALPTNMAEFMEFHNKIAPTWVPAVGTLVKLITLRNKAKNWSPDQTSNKESVKKLAAAFKAFDDELAKFDVPSGDGRTSVRPFNQYIRQFSSAAQNSLVRWAVQAKLTNPAELGWSYKKADEADLANFKPKTPEKNTVANPAGAAPKASSGGYSY
ncbi:hypothetical protein [Mycoplasmopsis alligatoris]|uniref:Lipoprotein n=1 Tax=Mycoplasmopsis alligatoris A21JP2 TaxID=747682 RepID=D4XWK9_9BACT|nr:hypothetical protein [Mycoplasmopsis alligatoris]EFF41298.1 hypothetical protein MALL_0420 [Mycoplasmopsis alligatoris A21JP2]